MATALEGRMGPRLSEHVGDTGTSPEACDVIGGAILFGPLEPVNR